MIFALNTVFASAVDVSFGDVTINDIVASGNIAGEVSRTVPVEVKFTANEDASDVKVKVYIEGYKSHKGDVKHGHKHWEKRFGCRSRTSKYKGIWCWWGWQ